MIWYPTARFQPRATSFNNLEIWARDTLIRYWSLLIITKSQQYLQLSESNITTLRISTDQLAIYIFFCKEKNGKKKRKKKREIKKNKKEPFESLLRHSLRCWSCILAKVWQPRCKVSWLRLSVLCYRPGRSIGSQQDFLRSGLQVSCRLASRRSVSRRSPSSRLPHHHYARDIATRPRIQSKCPGSRKLPVSRKERTCSNRFPLKNRTQTWSVEEWIYSDCKKYTQLY